jgi:hypothetical protein
MSAMRVFIAVFYITKSMVKPIAEERERIDDYRFAIGAAEFFNNRKYRPDLEWLILSYLTTALSAAGWECPVYAEKLEPPQPDFQTYIARGVPYRQVEVTEVLRPGYQRGDFHRQVALSGERIHNIPNPHPQPWLSFHHVLHSKLAKSYSDGSWLVIYHDMPDSEFQDYVPWHNRVLWRHH